MERDGFREYNITMLRFEIDLIVWKGNIRRATAYVHSRFEIDLIVWKALPFFNRSRRWFYGLR